MLDESIPLTTNEYDEWGNPNELQAYQDILAYSPYDNISAQDYPNILVTTGLHDSQVQYWIQHQHFFSQSPSHHQHPFQWIKRSRQPR